MKTETRTRPWRPVRKARRFPAHPFRENDETAHCAVCGETLRHPIHRWQTEDGPA